MFGQVVTKKNAPSMARWLKQNYAYVRVNGGVKVLENRIMYWTKVPFYSRKYDCMVTSSELIVFFGEELVRFED